MSEDPSNQPGPWERPAAPPPKPSRWDEIGANPRGLLQAVKAAAILGLIVALIRLLAR